MCVCVYYIYTYIYDNVGRHYMYNIYESWKSLPLSHTHIQDVPPLEPFLFSAGVLSHISHISLINIYLLCYMCVHTHRDNK